MPSVLTSNTNRGAGAVAYVGTVVVAAIIVMLAASTPWLSAGPRSLIEMAFRTLCHQRAERSFAVDGVPFAVCHRCFGIYAGIFLGLVGVVFLGRLRPFIELYSKRVLACMLLPMILDWVLDVAGIVSNSTGSRFATGLLAGCAGGLFLGLAFAVRTDRPASRLKMEISHDG